MDSELMKIINENLNDIENLNRGTKLDYIDCLSTFNIDVDDKHSIDGDIFNMLIRLNISYDTNLNDFMMTFIPNSLTFEKYINHSTRNDTNFKTFFDNIIQKNGYLLNGNIAQPLTNFNYQIVAVAGLPVKIERTITAKYSLSNDIENLRSICTKEIATAITKTCKTILFSRNHNNFVNSCTIDDTERQPIREYNQNLNSFPI
jgi:hypothetical protein